MARPSAPRVEDIRMTLPPRPCGIMTRPAARQSSQLWRTLASITASQSAGSWSTIGLGMLVPDPATTMSRPPPAAAAEATISLDVLLRRGSPGARWPPPRRRPRWPAPPPASFSALPPARVTCAPAPASAYGGLLAERAGRAGHDGRAPASGRRPSPGAAAWSPAALRVGHDDDHRGHVVRAVDDRAGLPGRDVARVVRGRASPRPRRSPP